MSRNSSPSLKNRKLEEILLPGQSEKPIETVPDLPTPPDPIISTALTFPRLLDFSFPEPDPEANVSQVGEVIYVGDGVCHVRGLDGAKIDEIIEIHTEKGVEKSLILGIQEDRLETVVLGDYVHIKRGDPAKLTRSKLKTPVGKALLGRVISPLGLPLDGKGPLNADHYREVETAAPGVVDRIPITVPLNTGILALDTTVPIGRGQRELVIGDRKTGKSRTMLDIICNQKSQSVYCIYVGIGMQAAKAKGALELLEKRGAMKYTTMIIAASDDPPSLQYLAPYVGAAIGEYYMYSGKHALIVFDDLSKQAKAYRQVSLLLKRSPGRDAYPGDIFFLHSRLLERASQLTMELGNGSLTALPVAETQTGDISDYIITNLMSITDGHIFLDANMMHEGIMPAINSGSSVSRIGGKVQTRLLQKVGELAGRILARYEEVKSFETINTEVTADTMRDIKRGKRIRELFSQDTDTSMNHDEEVIFLGIATSPRLDHWDMTHTKVFKESFIHFFRQLANDKLHEVLVTTKKIEEIDPLLDSIFKRFCYRYNLPPLPVQANEGE